MTEEQQQMLCGECHNKILTYQKYCRKCASYNRYYDHSYDNDDNSKIKRSEPTKYTLQLARALYSIGIDITLEAEIWYTSCNFYTPDILVNNEFIIIEVDGQIHDEPQIQKNDRIRQRALESSGYRVYRFKNQEIINSLQDVTAKIKSIILSKPRLSNNGIVNPNIIEIDVPEHDRMSNISEGFIRAYSIALNSTLITIEKWNASYFKEFLSKYDPTPIANRCAMEKIIFILLGLNLRARHDEDNDQPVIDFEHYSILFDKGLVIMNELFGRIGETELKNAYNITATNFIKNLIFYGKPRIATRRVVWIKDYQSIVSHINDFNKYFSRFGISIKEPEVKIECLGELQKIQRIIEEKKRIKQQQQQINNQEIKSVDLEPKRFGWYNSWLEESKSFCWLNEWIGYKIFE